MFGEKGGKKTLHQFLKHVLWMEFYFLLYERSQRRGVYTKILSYIFKILLSRQSHLVLFENCKKTKGGGEDIKLRP